jgi:hypothetical protein
MNVGLKLIVLILVLFLDFLGYKLYKNQGVQLNNRQELTLMIIMKIFNFKRITKYSSHFSTDEAKFSIIPYLIS